MTQHSTRKQFFAKLLGMTALAGLVPSLFAKKSKAPGVSPAVGAGAQRFTVRVDARAVARRGAV